MPTAPSFQAMTVMSETYIKNGRSYIDVKNEKTGTIRSVRWYTDAEYAKQYGNKSKENAATADIGFRGLKQARGFNQGPILLIRNWKTSDESWFGHSNARYATDVGWYIVSTESLPADYPSHFRFLLLSWSEFSTDETHAKSQAELSRIIRQKEKRGEYVLQ